MPEPPLRARGEAETRVISAGRAVGLDEGSKHPSSPRIFLAGAGGTDIEESSTSFDEVGQFKPARPSRLA